MPQRPQRLTAKDLARLNYDRGHRAPPRLNNSVRRSYDLLRSLLLSIGPEARLVESELVDALSASRSTVRTVLQQLADEGLVSRDRRTGTAPSWSATVFAIDRLMTLGEFAQTQSTSLTGQVLEVAVMPAPGLIGDRLRLDDDGWVVMVESLLLCDSSPIAISVSYVGLDAAERVAAMGDALDAVAFLEQSMNVCLGSGSSTVGALAADGETSTLLGIPEGFPLVWCEDILNDVHDKPRALCGYRFRADQVAFTSQARRWSPGSA